MNLLIFNLKTDANDDVLGFTTDWINSLSTHYNHVDVLTMHKGVLKTTENVTVYSIGKEHGYPKIFRAVLFYFYLIRILYNNKIDVCFAHMIPMFAVMGWPILKIWNIPIVLWYAHGKSPLTLKIAEKCVKKIVTSSVSGCHLSSKKIEIIGQGIDINRFKSPSNIKNRKTITILTIGRISRIKKLETLLKAISILKKRRPDFPQISLLIIGKELTIEDCKYKKELEKLIQNMGIAQDVLFAGAVPFKEIEKTYLECDIFVNTSKTNSVDKVVLEAMACEIPVLTSNIAFKEIFTSEQEKICMFPENDPNALSNKLEEFVLKSREERKRIGESLRDTIKHGHSLEQLSKRIVTVLQKIKEK